MQINSTSSTRGGMQPFCLRFGEEVNTSLSQQLHCSTTYGTWRVGVGWGGIGDCTLIVHIRIFGYLDKCWEKGSDVYLESERGEK